MKPAPASMTTDHASSTEAPRPCLCRIAEAGFTHVHRCQQWNSPHRCAEEEVEGLRAFLREARAAARLRAPPGR